MNPIRIGIIGVGQIGKQHLENYSKIPAAQVVAACDIDAPELARVSEKYKIANTYHDFRKLLERDDLDAVDVCLHNNYHSPVSVAVMESGKHCYCEKPIAGTYADGAAMLEASRRTGRMLSIQLSTLFSKETRIAKRMIDGGSLGRVYHARSTGYRRRGRPFVDGYGTRNFVDSTISGGGALFDMGVYHISRLLFLLGCPQVLRVGGTTYQETDMHAGRRAESGYNVEELGLGFVRLAGGITMDIIESWAIQLNKFEGSSIVGSQGGLRFDPLTFHTTINDIEMNCSPETDSVNTRWSRTETDQDAYESSQHHWIAALQQRVPLIPTASIALQTMLISEGIYQSGKLGRELDVEEVKQNSRSSAVKV